MNQVTERRSHYTTIEQEFQPFSRWSKVFLIVLGVSCKLLLSFAHIWNFSFSQREMGNSLLNPVSPFLNNTPTLTAKSDPVYRPHRG